MMKRKHSLPFYHQYDIADCGPTALRMIAGYYGKTYSIETLRSLCGISRNGVSMLGISNAAERIGFRTLGVRISFEQLATEATMPCILHWNQEHFVVCKEIRKGRNGKYHVYISDPASQRLCYSKEEFLACWLCTRDRGSALLLIPGPNFAEGHDDTPLPTSNVSYLMRYLLPFKGHVAYILACMLAGSLLQLLMPFLTKAMVDVGISDRNMGVVTIILMAQFFILVAQLGVDCMREWIMLQVSSRIGMSLISDFMARLMDMPIKYFETKKTGDIMQRIGDHSRIRNFLMGNMISMAFAVVGFVVFSVVLAIFNLSILAVFLLGNLLYVAWTMSFMKYRREVDIKRFNQSSTEQSKTIQIIQGIHDIKLNNCERKKRWEWERVQVRLYKIGVKGLAIRQLQQTGTVFFSQATNIIITLIAANSVINGTMTLGMMMSLSYIVGQLSGPVSTFVSFVRSFQDAKISLERLNEVNAVESENVGDYADLQSVPKEKDIRVEHVSFCYDGTEENLALNDISLDIPANKVTAIVGESGCGKTTLIKLLQGLYTSYRGTVKVGGHDLRSINVQQWRNVIGSVMQDSFLFSDTIAKNIALSDDSVDAGKLLEAARLANIDEFISCLPLGYNTKIGMEGIGVSQGQRQRILIARAIYKTPEFLFLDEATNALDSTNEKIIMESLNSFCKGKTVVIAAHRLSTVRCADQIVVMRNGRIAEVGSHKELLERKGAYFSLVKDQVENAYG